MDPFLLWLKNEKLLCGRIRRYLENRSAAAVPHIYTFCRRYSEIKVGVNTPYNIIKRIHERENTLNLTKLKEIIRKYDDIFEYTIKENGSVGIVDFLVSYGGYEVDSSALALAESCGRDELLDKYAPKQGYCVIN
jgi:hypothetical protein